MPKSYRAVTPPKLIAVALLYDDDRYVAAKIRRVVYVTVTETNGIGIFAPQPVRTTLELEVELDMETGEQATQDMLEAGRRTLDELPE